MKIRNWSHTHQILKAIKFMLEETKGIAYDYGPGFSALISRRSLDEVMSAMPGYKGDRMNRHNYQASFSRLKKGNYIKLSDRDNFVLTDKGEGVLLKFDIDKVTLPEFNPEKWDGIWRVLIFDIPELTRAVRNIFRSKIQEMEFYTLQKSVYVTPIVCEKEINELSGLLNIRNGVEIIHASKLGRKEAAIRRFFDIS